MTNSCNKGKTGERELAKYLREMGFDARRTQQHCGYAGDSDVIIEGSDVFIECKRQQHEIHTELFKGWVKTIWQQCNRKPWLLFHRNDRKPWHLTYVPPGAAFAHTIAGDAEIKQVVIALVHAREKGQI